MRDVTVQKSTIAPKFHQVAVDCGVVFDLRKMLGLGDNIALVGSVRIVRFILRDGGGNITTIPQAPAARLTFMMMPSIGALTVDCFGTLSPDASYSISGELDPLTMIGKIDSNTTMTPDATPELTIHGLMLEFQISSTNLLDHAAVFDRSEDIVEIDHAVEARDHLLELVNAFPESGLSESTMDVLDQIIMQAKKLKRRQLMDELAESIIYTIGSIDGTQPNANGRVYMTNSFDPMIRDRKK